MNQDAIDAVELALNMLDCSQKELALKLKVSPTQISKWKNGEYMSSEMEDRIKALVKIGDHYPAVVLWAGSVENAEKWTELFRRLGKDANDGGASGYETYPLRDEMGLLSLSTIRTLTDMGVVAPKTFPKALDSKCDDDDDLELIDKNPYSSLVDRIYQSLTDVYGFYIAYVDDLISDSDDLVNTAAANIEPCLIDLAASKIENIDEKFAPKFRQFKYKVRKDYAEWLTLVKNSSLRAGAPLRAELMDMVNDDHDSLGRSAEDEALGSSEARAHPDIYMNELLEGIRIIKRALPAIMKKIGIDEKDFSSLVD